MGNGCTRWGGMNRFGQCVDAGADGGFQTKIQYIYGRQSPVVEAMDTVAEHVPTVSPVSVGTAVCRKHRLEPCLPYHDAPVDSKFQGGYRVCYGACQPGIVVETPPLSGR